MALLVVFSHQNLILNVKVANVVVQVDVLADQESRNNRVLYSGTES